MDHGQNSEGQVFDTGRERVAVTVRIQRMALASTLVNTFPATTPQNLRTCDATLCIGKTVSSIDETKHSWGTIHGVTFIVLGINCHADAIWPVC